MSDWPRINPAPPAIAISPGSDLSSIYDGLLAWGIGGEIVTQAWVANLAMYVPFVISDHIVVQRGVWENGATVAGNVSIGIYDSEQNCCIDNNGGYAESHTAMSGASAAQERAFANNITLEPGLYYMGFASDSATATLSTCTLAADASVLRSLGVFEQTSAYPLPTPKATFAACTRTFAPYFALVGRSLS